MQKPSGYDEAKASGEFIQADLGGHYCEIIQVSETKTKTGKDQIVVLFDFCKQDKQDGLFGAQYKNDERPKDEKKWPFAGSMYVTVNDYNDDKKTSRAFKTFCTCVEKSNNFEIEWGIQNWSKQFKGKKIGVVYGEVENEYEGKTYMRHNPRWFCSWDSVKDAKVPNPKYLESSPDPANARMDTAGDAGFMNIPDDAEDEIPF